MKERHLKVPHLQAPPDGMRMASVPADDVTPPDLPRAVRGYDPSAVHTYLGELEAQRALLAKQLDAALLRITELEERLSAAEERAEAVAEATPDRREEETLLRDALVTAQKAANDVREQAHREAEEIIESARRSSEQVAREAEEERDRLSEEIRWLENHADASRGAVTKLLESLLDEVQARSADVTERGEQAVFDDEILRPKRPRGGKAVQPESQHSAADSAS
jgi:cell division initiation protein